MSAQSGARLTIAKKNGAEFIMWDFFLYVGSANTLFVDYFIASGFKGERGSVVFFCCFELASLSMSFGIVAKDHLI